MYIRDRQISRLEGCYNSWPHTTALRLGISWASPSTLMADGVRVPPALKNFSKRATHCRLFLPLAISSGVGPELASRKNLMATVRCERSGAINVPLLTWSFYWVCIGYIMLYLGIYNHPRNFCLVNTLPMAHHMFPLSLTSPADVPPWALGLDGWLPASSWPAGASAHVSRGLPRSASSLDKRSHGRAYCHRGLQQPRLFAQRSHRITPTRVCQEPLGPYPPNPRKWREHQMTKWIQQGTP